LQLQKDLRSDTDLRQELVRDIERAKGALAEEVQRLEAELAEERRKHADTRTERYRLDREAAARSVAAAEAAETAETQIRKLEADIERLRLAAEASVRSPEATSFKEKEEMNSRIRDLERLLEDKNRYIDILM